MLLVSCSFVALVAPPASADCTGPTLKIDDRDVRRGEVIRVVGDGWGDNCHDTGLPSDAHGFLGNPLTDIEIAFVQDGEEIVTARGSADDDYHFEAWITVPSDLRPGIARLDGRSGINGSFARPTVTISTAKPVGPEHSTVQTFGGPRESIHDPEPATTEDSDARGWLIGGAVAIVLAAAAVLILRRRSADSD